MTRVATVILLVLEVSRFLKAANVVVAKTTDSANFPPYQPQYAESMGNNNNDRSWETDIPNQAGNVRIHEEDEAKRVDDDFGFLNDHESLDVADSLAPDIVKKSSGMRNAGPGKRATVNTYDEVVKNSEYFHNHEQKSSPVNEKPVGEASSPNEMEKHDLERIFRRRRNIDEDYGWLNDQTSRLQELFKRVSEVKSKVGAGMRYAGLGKRRVGAGMRYASLSKRGVEAGMRYTGLGKRGVGAGMRYAGLGKRKLNVRSRVDAGMRYMGIGKRPALK